MSTEDTTTAGTSASKAAKPKGAKPKSPPGEENAVAPPELNENSEAGEAQAPAAELSPEELAQALQIAREEAEKHWESVLRVRAEIENLRKRSQRDIEHAHKYGLERFVEELLPIRDSMELGLTASREEGASTEKMGEGLELTLRMLIGAMEKFGIEEIDPANAPFDPDFHQAMSMQEVEGVESGTVTTVVQKGFALNGRLVRPALVMVAK